MSGPAVKPGSSGESLLIRRVSEQASRMPLGQPPLSNSEIAILRDWVDAGAVWDAGIAPVQVDTRIKPRRPAVPASSRLNPIDAFVGTQVAGERDSGSARCQRFQFLPVARISISPDCLPRPRNSTAS